MTLLLIIGGVWAMGSLAFVTGLGVAASRHMPKPDMPLGNAEPLTGKICGYEEDGVLAFACE